MTGTFMEGLLSSIADRGRALLDLDRRLRPEKMTPSELAEALLSGRGEASGASSGTSASDASGVTASPSSSRKPIRTPERIARIASAVRPRQLPRVPAMHAC